MYQIEPEYQDFHDFDELDYNLAHNMHNDTSPRGTDPLVDSEQVCDIFNQIVRGHDVRSRLEEIQTHHNELYILRRIGFKTLVLSDCKRQTICPCAHRFEYLEDIDNEDPRRSDIEDILTYILQGRCSHVAEWQSITESSPEVDNSTPAATSPFGAYLTVRTRDDVFISFIHLATAVGDIRLLKYITKSLGNIGPGSISSTGHCGLKPIHLAIAKHQSEVLQYMLCEDANIQSSLMFEAECKVSYASDVSNKATPLVMSLFEKREDLAIMMIQSGKIRTRESINYLIQIFRLAVDIGSPSLLISLFELFEGLQTFQQYDRNSIEYTILIYAIGKEKANMVEVLLDQMISPNLQCRLENCGTVPYPYYAAYARELPPILLPVLLNNTVILSLLLRYGANVHVTWNINTIGTHNTRNCTLLEIAKFLEYSEIISILEQSGCQCNNTTTLQNLPRISNNLSYVLSLWSQDKFLELVTKRVSMGHDINEQDADGNTILLRVDAQERKKHEGEIAKRLMELGADPLIRNKSNRCFYLNTFSSELILNLNRGLRSLKDMVFAANPDMEHRSTTCSALHYLLSDFGRYNLVQYSVPMLSFLMDAGYRFPRKDVEMLLTVGQKPLYDKINDCLCAPRSLRELSRNCLRQRYPGRQIHRFVDIIHCPRFLKDYLLLKEMCGSNGAYTYYCCSRKGHMYSRDIWNYNKST